MAIDQISSAGLAAGGVEPADLSTGAPSWDASGNFQFNSGYGSVATAYGCRAWVNFDGTTAGTNPVAMTIRGSGNVSSVTRAATGTYDIAFTTALVDTNYCAIGAPSGDGSIAGEYGDFISFSRTGSTASNLRVYTANDSSSVVALSNYSQVTVAVFR
jgi:hypothetical protein